MTASTTTPRRMGRLRHYWPKTTRSLAFIASMELVLGVAYLVTQVLR